MSEDKYLIASNSKRIIAVLIECFLYWLISLLYLPLQIMCSIFFPLAIILIPLVLLGVLIVFAYRILMVWKLGGTLGKKIMKIRIVRIDYKNISLLQSFLRELPPIIVIIFIISMNRHIGTNYLSIELLFPLYWLVCLFMIFLVNKKRTIHDYFAKTIVVESKMGQD